MPAGRPTDMTDAVLAKMEEGIVNGRTMKDLAKECGVSESTVYEWKYRNYGNFADKVENWRLKAKLLKAESRADEILSLPLQDIEGKIDGNVLRVIQKEAEFLRETLAKTTYSKRQEMTGQDGDPLYVVSVLADKYGINTGNSTDTSATSDSR